MWLNCSYRWKMSLHMIFTLIQLLPLKTPSFGHPEVTIAEERWTYWFYLFSSKGIYSILVSLIIFCCFLNAIKNKFGVKDAGVDQNFDLSKWIDRLWKNVGGNRLISCSPLSSYRLPGFGFNSFDFEDELRDGRILHEKVLIAENELSALKNAVEITRKASTYLEESLEEIEKDKDDIEGRSIVEKQWMTSEIDNFKADMEMLQDQLISLKKEKEDVLERCAVLQAEAMKAGEALKKRQEIQEKLDEAMTVVSVLRQAVADLEADRDEAMASISGQYDLRDSKEEPTDIMPGIVFRNVQCSPEFNLSRSACLEDLHLLGRGDDLPPPNSHVVEEEQWINYDEQGYGEVIVSSWARHAEAGSSEEQHVYHEISDKPQNDAGDFVEEIEDEDIRTDQEFDDDQIELSRNVQLTKSVAFKQFLQSNFGQY